MNFIPCRRLPGTDDELPILGFGAMRLPERDGKIDRENAIRIIRHAIDQGIVYIDTSWTYHDGESEIVVGEALRDGYREKVRIATKMPQWLVTCREDMDRFLALQMEKLGTRHIDFYLVHALTGGHWERLVRLGIGDFLETAKADGRISYAGFSFHDTFHSFREIIDGYSWDFCQIQYNYLDENTQAGTGGLKYAAERGIGVFVMEPLRGGSLVKRIPPAVTAIFAKSDLTRTPAAWALRWIWDHPEVTMVLSGMNEIVQIDENRQTASEGYPCSLTGEEHDVIRQVSETYKNLMIIPCTSCRYCMPCPYGVNIPECFDLYNSAHIFDITGRYTYRHIYETHHVFLNQSGASLCKKCGGCEKKCPQKIPIRDYLEQVRLEFEGPDIGLIGRIMEFIRSIMTR